MGSRRTVRVALLVLMAAGLLASLELLRAPEATILWKAIFDAGHAPLFGLLALGLLGLSLLLLPWSRRDRWRHYVLALTVALGLGVLTEAWQFFGPRDADLWDLLRNALGASSFLLFAATLDPQMAARFPENRLPLRAMLRVVAVTVFLLPLVPAAVVGSAYLARNAAHPVIHEFRSYWESFFLETVNSRVTLAYLPEDLRGEDPENLVLEAKFYGGHDYPRVFFHEPYPDWSGYEALAFTVWSGQDEPVRLVFRVADAPREARKPDPFKRVLRVEPGVNRFRIPLAEIRDDEPDREFDLSRVWRFSLVVRKPPETVVLYVDDFRLE